MKKKFLGNYLFVILLSLTVALASCSNENEVISSEEEINIEDLKLLVKEKYDAELSVINDNEFTVVYGTGKVLEAKKIDSHNYLFSGTVFSGAEYVFDELKFEKESPTIAFTLNNDFGNLRSPCGQHGSDEAFDDCFKREFDDFCDGFIGCVALATNPVLISGVIAGHCLACEAFAEEEEEENESSGIGTQV